MRVRWLIVLFATVGLTVAGCDSNSSGDDQSQEEAEAQSPDESGDDSESESGSSELPFEATGTVAVVNGNEITADEYNEQAKKMSQGMPGKMPYPVAKRFKSRTLDQLIERHLIDKKIEEAGIEVTDDEVSKEFKRVKDRLSQQIPEGKDFKWFLERQNMSEDEFKNRISKQLRLEKLLKNRDGISVSDEEAKKYYQNNKSEFEKKERVKARHILVKTGPDAGSKEINSAKEKAQAISEEARSGDKDFAKLAEEKSEGPSARRGGDLGYFTKDKMMPTFSEKAFSMKEGEISDPVKTDQGFHVIKKEGTKPAETTSYEDAKEDIVRKLERKQLKSAMKGFVEELKKDADIQKNEGNITLNVEKGQGARGGGQGGGIGKALKKQLKKKAQQKAEQQSGESGSEGSEGSGESSEGGE